MSITIVGTGGTIASTAVGEADADPDRSPEEIVADTPELTATVDLDFRDFARIPGTHVRIEQMFELAELVGTLDSDDATDGIVVTHGTDTLAETAYFVDLCYDGETPVTFTGAMRKPPSRSPDGPQNLHDSIQVVRSERASAVGVTVTFDQYAHLARDVRKMHTGHVGGFRSPEFGPLAAIDGDTVVWRRVPSAEDRTFRPDREALTTEVLAVTATADMSDTLLHAGLESDGVCLSTMGGGELVPETIGPALEALGEAGVPVVATTRCPEGRLDVERSMLTDFDVLFSDVNGLHKTRLKTIVALAANRLDEAFER
ncbi:asparaginase [Halorussus salinisoli]|uniref:asparaginase n=1 Tax=Halorussus salinisoli TaxID=2558242 RepID=UPI0010C1D2B7|nr:asparaginase [Halorussus salinisoli]